LIYLQLLALFIGIKKTAFPEIVLDDAVTLAVGEELYQPRCVNKTGVDIPNGSVVYISGAQGHRPTIALADASACSTSRKILGITTQDIPNNQEGRVTIHGLVKGLNTSAYAAGTCLFLSVDAGDYEDSTPTYGMPRIKIGTVVASHVTQGSITMGISERHYMFGKPDEDNYSYFEDNGTLVIKVMLSIT
jgi:hypothetical protein